MKIAIPVIQNTVAGAFGRTETFTIYDTETQTFHHIQNTINANSAHGAGIQTATSLVNAGIDIVLSPRIGPKAFQVLKAANIACYVITDKNLEISKALEQYQQGSLDTMTAAKV